MDLSKTIQSIICIVTGTPAVARVYMNFEAKPIKEPMPPPPPMPPDCTSIFITVIAAPFIASCLLPDEAPPDWSKRLPASAIALPMSMDCMPPPPPPPPPPPEVNCLRI